MSSHIGGLSFGDTWAGRRLPAGRGASRSAPRLGPAHLCLASGHGVKHERLRHWVVLYAGGPRRRRVRGLASKAARATPQRSACCRRGRRLPASVGWTRTAQSQRSVAPAPLCNAPGIPAVAFTGQPRTRVVTAPQGVDGLEPGRSAFHVKRLPPPEPWVCHETGPDSSDRGARLKRRPSAGRPGLRPPTNAMAPEGSTESVAGVLQAEPNTKTSEHPLYMPAADHRPATSHCLTSEQAARHRRSELSPQAYGVTGVGRHSRVAGVAVHGALRRSSGRA
jgi:hypothetical protein